MSLVCFPLLKSDLRLHFEVVLLTVSTQGTRRLSYQIISLELKSELHR